MRRRYPDPQRTVEAWARQFSRGSGAIDTYELLTAMAHATRDDFTYVRREEVGTQTPAETLRLRSGSCRDFALLMIEAARSLGLASRFVSGYLNVHSNPNEASHGGGSTHAWVEVYIPGAGWVEFDPTNDILGNRDLIRVAVARDPRQAIPVYGTFTGGTDDYIRLDVEVDIHIAAEAPTERSRVAA
jgi:transglutaminase-like putative cysteine protease